MTLAVIPARGGSKRIPRKNLRPFLGKPILAYSIQTAQASGLFHQIVVSTDDPEIADCAKAWGADVPYLRPPHLSDDQTGTVAVMAHAVHAAQAGGWQGELACCIYATAPTLTPTILEEGMRRLLGSPEAWYAISMTSFPFPVQRGVRLLPGGGMDLLHPEHRLTRSQDLEPIFHDAGQFYWGRAEAWKAQSPLFTAACLPVLLPRSRVQDIDTEEDWERAEVLYRLLELERP